MAGIEAVFQRVSQIQQRVAAYAPPTQDFEEILANQLGPDAAPTAPASTLYGTSPSTGLVTIGAFIYPRSPLTTGRYAPVWRGGIASVWELESYVGRHSVEERNGRLADHEMQRVEGGWGGRDLALLPPAAESWTAMRAAAAADGVKLFAVDAYRDWDAQARAHREFLAGNKPANVLPPGRSQHGNGLAVDVTNGSVIDRNDPEWRWLQDNAQRFGWYPISNESWHWEFRGVGA